MTDSWRKLIVPAIAAGLAFGVLVALGFWQLHRLQWKEALIARVEARIDGPAAPAPGPAAWPTLDLVELEYQPVSVNGRFLHQYEAHVFTALSAPRGAFGGMGYFVTTPLETPDGWLVYVNRGFVPEDRKDEAERRVGQISGPVTVVGLLRAPRGRSWSSAEDDPSDNVWFARDPALFATWSDLDTSRVAPYTIDLRFDPELAGGLPQGGETFVDFPNNHLGYALTWFGLAAALVGVFVVFVRSRLTQGR